MLTKRYGDPDLVASRVVAPIVGALMGAAVIASTLGALPALADSVLPTGSTAIKTVGIALAVGLDVLALGSAPSRGH